MVVMRLVSVGMGQRTAGTQHDQRRINRYGTGGDGTAVAYQTEAFHLIQPLSIPIHLSHPALSTFGVLLHESLCAVYLQMPTHATVVTSCKDVQHSYPGFRS
jgi:hypothetical protein